MRKISLEEDINKDKREIYNMSKVNVIGETDFIIGGLGSIEEINGIVVCGYRLYTVDGSEINSSFKVPIDKMDDYIKPKVKEEMKALFRFKRCLRVCLEIRDKIEELYTKYPEGEFLYTKEQVIENFSTARLNLTVQDLMTDINELLDI